MVWKFCFFFLKGPLLPRILIFLQFSFKFRTLRLEDPLERLWLRLLIVSGIQVSVQFFFWHSFHRSISQGTTPWKITPLYYFIHEYVCFRLDIPPIDTSYYFWERWCSSCKIWFYCFLLTALCPKNYRVERGIFLWKLVPIHKISASFTSFRYPYVRHARIRLYKVHMEKHFPF